MEVARSNPAGEIFFFHFEFFAFRAQEAKAPVTYCDQALSVVCPSFRLLTFSTSFPEPLDGFLCKFVGVKYSLSLTSVVIYQPNPPLMDPGRVQNSHKGPHRQITS